MLIIDGHLDLADSALSYRRDLSRPLAELRARENPQAVDGTLTVCLPELARGGVGIVFGTLFVMPHSIAQKLGTVAITYRDDAPPEYLHQQAHEGAMRQLDVYRRWADQSERVRIIDSHSHLKDVLSSQEDDKSEIGIVVHIEGADPIRDPAEIELWHEYGVRSIGLAWQSTHYAPSTEDETARLPRDGYRMLERMLSLQMIADLTHMGDKAAYDVLEMYDGPLAITHTTCRALVPHKRCASDRQIRMVAERGGVVGIMLLNEALRKGHRHGDPKELVTLDHVVAHIDHVCQLVGSAENVAIGSDLDGGFGAEDTPTGIDSIADLYKVADALKQCGYDNDSISKIMSGNWLRLLKTALG